jgi:hypothetical protein
MKITKRSSKDNDDNGENPPTDNNTYAHLSTENLITQNDDSKD